MTHIFSLVTYYRPNRSKLLIPCIVLSYIVIVPDPSIRDIVRPVHRDRPASLPPAIMPAATLANADIVVARYLLERPLLPPPLPHSWDFWPACGQKESVGIELPPSSRSKSRWSRHTGQCYSSVSFLQFFLCTLLPLSLRLSFSVSSISSSPALSIRSSLQKHVIVARVCQFIFLRA